MKKIGTLVILMAILASCKPEIKEIGPRFVPGDGIFGQWEMNQLVVTDLTLPVPESRSFNGFLAKTENRLIMTFKADGSYTVDQAGKVPQDLGTNGNWAYDALDFPKRIHFVTAEGDSINAELLNMPRTIDVNFGFKFDRRKCDKKNINYEFNFMRK